MKNRILPLLLAFVMLLNIIPTSAFAGDGVVSAEATQTACELCGTDPCSCEPVAAAAVDAPVCDKGCNKELVGEHTDDCAVKVYYKELFNNSTAKELYSVWGKLPADAQDYILNNIAWNDQIKRSELLALIESGETENPCGCCDSCTGEENCQCQCEGCICKPDEEEPTVPEEVPSVSDTVNGQKVTVSGEALPEDAELKVSKASVCSDVLDLLFEDKGTTVSYDISIGDNQLNGTVQITISGLPFPEGESIKVIHYLDDVDAIIAGIETGVIQVRNINRNAYGADVFTAEVSAGKEAESKLNIEVPIDTYNLYFTVSTCTVTDGSVTFETDSFSVYTLSNGNWSGANATASTGFGTLNEIVMFDFVDDHYGYGKGSFVVYATPNQTLYFDEGAAGAQNLWEISGKTGYVKDWSSAAYEARFTVKPASELVFYDGAEVVVYDSCTYWFSRYYSYATVRFVPECTITYKLADNSPADASLTTTSTSTVLGNGTTAYPYSKIKLPTPNTPKGYTFAGWYDAQGNRVGGASSTYEIKGDGNSTNPKATVATTLYAKWEPITYTVKFDANTANAGGGTISGSMSNLAMIYDVETTLPRSQFVNSADGYVFLGWATSPTGDVVYKDGVKVKNLTATDGGTVTLYAKWMYGLNTAVHIGINNSYHNPNGTYKAGDVTIKSYHTYPNEPAQMTADFDRVTDSSGSWTFSSDSPALKNKASSYINGNIFNSPDYEMTYVEGQNTLGLADPTGTKVKAMLKFTDADYTAMISAWLNAKRSTLVGYNDPNFNWSTAKAEDFTMVPYVIKFEDYSNWYIDMVVVPKALYTLAYDGNIENGYTASFTGVAFPPSAQYTDGYAVPVVTTPIGYQSNGMKVTKVVDGHTYEAKFLYWYDADGNTYGGSTGKNAITLTKDTILYAKWEYPDASYGNLDITNRVVDNDDYSAPTADQKFTFTFATSASGSYSYTIYDAGMNVKGSGSISNGGTFQLQDGWRIRIVDMPKNATYSATGAAVSYYTASGVISGTVSAGATTYAAVTNTYQKYAGYTVKHHLQNSDKTGYIEQTADRQNLYGVIGAQTTASAKTYPGYNATAISQKSINANGTTTVDIYYDAVSLFTITWVDDDGTVLDEQQLEYGATPMYGGAAPQKDATAQYTYEFTGWTPNVATVTDDATYTATYSSTVRQYTMSGEIDHGTVTGPVTVDYGSYASIRFVPSPGYAFVECLIDDEEPDPIDPGASAYNLTSGALSRDIHAVVRTKLIDYTITYELNGGALEEGVTNPETYTVETSTFTLNNPTKAGYVFKGWATEKDADSGTKPVTIEKGSIGNLTFYAVWELAVADLTITASGTNPEQSYIFTVTGYPSDPSYDIIKLDVVVNGNESVTIKSLPIGTYKVHEKSDWTWRQAEIADQNVILDTDRTVIFDFGSEEQIYWLSGCSYNKQRKKGGSN